MTRQKEMSSVFHVERIPTLILFVDGVEVSRVDGLGIEPLIERYRAESSKVKPKPEAADSALESIRKLEMELKLLLEKYGRQHPKVKEIDTRLKALQALEDRTGTASSSTGSPTSLILRSAEEFGRRLHEAEEEFGQAMKLEEKGYASAATVESSRRQLAIIRQEYAAQIRLLELELKEAELAADAAVEHRDRQKRLREAGIVTSSEMAEAQLDADTAQLGVERAKTLLELYRKAGHTEQPQLEPVDEEARADGSGTENPAELIWNVLGVRLRPLSQDALPNERYRGGMQITEIRKEGPAAEAMLKVDDIIVGLHRWETTSVENVVFVLNHSALQPKPNQPCDVKVFLLRDGETLFAMLHLADRAGAARQRAPVDGASIGR
jgi:hypothetical protein